MKLSKTMAEVLALMDAHDGVIERWPGGFWWEVV